MTRKLVYYIQSCEKAACGICKKQKCSLNNNKAVSLNTFSQ